jgi:hypothetical protein
VLSIDQTPSGAVMTFNGGHPIGDFPIVTQQLLPVMIYDQVNSQPLLRYPGALFTSTNTTPSSSGITPSGYVVRVPVLTTSGAAQTLSWVYPLEPILDSAGNDAFSLAATTTSGINGAVALRITGPPDNPLVPILASGSVSSSRSPPGVGGPAVSDFQYGPYAGANGLGEQAAWATTVRPYRSVISAQAIYRREVFQ